MPASVTASPAGAGTVDQRARILATALELMGERGVAKTSMRRLASACGLNVATLYHYFPSKAELVRALLFERRYTERLREEQPTVDPSLPPPARLESLFAAVWEGTLAEESVWRVLVSESIQGDASVRSAIDELVSSVSDGLAAWMSQLFPELAAGPVDVAMAARLVRSTLFALIVEELAVGEADATVAAADLASVLFPGG
ncbi:MAG TPA: TetR/AcrR family transcriptional regulator [Acidimicrobiales bacterium]|jgi:AcrR family transcriptional regulator|nr:TetR/AcrR family transcriptional regulator [Acidimicrobiales bacterium]